MNHGTHVHDSWHTRKHKCVETFGVLILRMSHGTNVSGSWRKKKFDCAEVFAGVSS